MSDSQAPVLIFGKSNCPYTMAARESYEARRVVFEYIDVKAHPAELSRMLQFSGGKRVVPVIVDNGKTKIGFGGT